MSYVSSPTTVEVLFPLSILQYNHNATQRLKRDLDGPLTDRRYLCTILVYDARPGIRAIGSDLGLNGRIVEIKRNE